MYMYKYIGDIPNFGDELNDYIWPKLLPDFFDADKKELFLGVGSILYDDLPQSSTKIVCGAGFGGYTTPPNVHDGSWDIYFVRGPLTAKRLNLPESLALGDPGILVRQFTPSKASSGTEFSYMPHVNSLGLGVWREVCEVTGVRFIDPSSPVEQILGEIQSTDVLISEALHGVIAADALRTPWIAIRPLEKINRMKWFDWERSMNLEIDNQDMCSSTVRELFRNIYIKHPRAVSAFNKITFGAGRFFDELLFDRVVKKIHDVKKAKPQLSSPSRIDELTDKMTEKMQLVRSRYS